MSGTIILKATEDKNDNGQIDGIEEVFGSATNRFIGGEKNVIKYIAEIKMANDAWFKSKIQRKAI